MMRSQRTTVAAALEELARPGGDLNRDSSRSTWNMYGDRRSRLTAWQEMTEEFLDRQRSVSQGGRIAVVAAGAPGAGKTTALDGSLNDTVLEYRRIDPDIIKDLILARAIDDNIYEHLLRRRLPDGLPIMPRELSGLVHEESVQLASRIRRLCMRRGENVVIEGTLGWHGMIDVHLAELTGFGYDQLDVVYVETEQAVAMERVLDRWWTDRYLPGEQLGGRFVPRSVVRACWTVDGGSICLQNAQELHRRASRQEGLITSITTSAAAPAQQSTDLLTRPTPDTAE